jgi:uncharacterized protein YkvS
MSFSGYNNLVKLFEGEDSFTILVEGADIKDMATIIDHFPETDKNAPVLAIRLGDESKEDMDKEFDEDVSTVDNFQDQSKNIDDYKRFALFIESDFHEFLAAAYIGTDYFIPIKVVQKKSFFGKEYNHYMVSEPLEQLAFLEKIRDNSVFDFTTKTDYLPSFINSANFLNIVYNIPNIVLVYTLFTKQQYLLIFSQVICLVGNMIKYAQKDGILLLTHQKWGQISKINNNSVVVSVLLSPVFNFLNINSIVEMGCQLVIMVLMILFEMYTRDGLFVYLLFTYGLSLLHVVFYMGYLKNLEWMIFGYTFMLCALYLQDNKEKNIDESLYTFFCGVSLCLILYSFLE